jgi:O-antigen/teichoic acid export membrane protein
MSGAQNWSVRGIDPKIREAAREAAARQGMSLGEYLNQALAQAEPAGREQPREQNREPQREVRAPAHAPRPRPSRLSAHAYEEDGAPNRLRWDKDALAQMMSFGRWIFASTVLTFLVGQSDRLIFGALIPLAALGVYSVAAMIALLPATALSRMASSVFFPIYSRIHNEGRELSPVFLRMRRPLLVFGGWLIGGLAGGGQSAVQLLYDDRYAQAGWILQWLALGCWFAVLEGINSAALLARGQSNWTAAASAGKLAGMLTLIPLGFHLGGFPGAVVGLALSDVLKYAVSAFAVSRAGLPCLAQDLRLTAWVLASAALGHGAARVAEDAGGSEFATALAVLLTVTLAWLPLSAQFWSAKKSAAPQGTP